MKSSRFLFAILLFTAVLSIISSGLSIPSLVAQQTGTISINIGTNTSTSSSHTGGGGGGGGGGGSTTTTTITSQTASTITSTVNNNTLTSTTTKIPEFHYAPMLVIVEIGIVAVTCRKQLQRRRN